MARLGLLRSKIVIGLSGLQYVDYLTTVLHYVSRSLGISSVSSASLSRRFSLLLLARLPIAVVFSFASSIAVLYCLFSSNGGFVLIFSFLDMPP